MASEEAVRLDAAHRLVRLARQAGCPEIERVALQNLARVASQIGRPQ